jgi:FtsH-binding integral membrane protein
MKTGGSLSIWFFVGIALLVTGLLICGAGAYELFHPPAQKVVLYKLHANLWWGALLALIGGVYCVHFAPGKGRV